MTRFIDKVVGLHRALDRADLPHAFGGAIALAMCTLDPRATDDIDINIFVVTRRLPEVEAALPVPITITASARTQLRRDAQARLFWDKTPVDVFLSDHPLHGESRLRVRTRVFAGIEMPFLACEDLAVFKAMSGRPRDALDIAEMVRAGAIDLPEVEATVKSFVEHDRNEFLAKVRDLVDELEAG